MTNTPQNQLADLLIQQSTSGLSNAEQRQLVQLQRENNLSDSDLQNEIERLEFVAAAADLASFQNDTTAMPDHVKDCVLVEAGKFFESQIATSDTNVASFHAATRQTHSQSKNPATGINGWMIFSVLATAACILLLLNPISISTSEPLPRVAMQQFLDSNPADLVDVEMVPGFDANGKQITKGRLVWSDSNQEGYMEFTGMKVNNPSKEQYQLWIFDEAGQKHPVDGGVFDITSENDVIRIDPKIYAEGKYFAVTVEKPPGVVVSKRERIATADPQLAAIVAESLNAEAK